MASQILSGSSNPTYTNNTGQNVRLVFNILENASTISWAGVTLDLNDSLDFGSPDKTGANPYPRIHGMNRLTSTSNNALTGEPRNPKLPTPTQLSLAPGQTFSAVCGKYNFVVIKEDGT